jgi:hypothetical protein
VTSLYTIPLTEDKYRLHPRKLAKAQEWDENLDHSWWETQRGAHLASARGDSTVVLSARLVLALARKVATLEASNEALRQMREKD